MTTFRHRDQVIKVNDSGRFITEDEGDFKSLDDAKKAIDKELTGVRLEVAILDPEGGSHVVRGVNKATGSLMFEGERSAHRTFGHRGYFVDRSWVREALEERTRLAKKIDDLDKELQHAKLASFGGRQQPDVNIKYHQMYDRVYSDAENYGKHREATLSDPANVGGSKESS